MLRTVRAWSPGLVVACLLAACGGQSHSTRGDASGASGDAAVTAGRAGSGGTGGTADAASGGSGDTGTVTPGHGGDSGVAAGSGPTSMGGGAGRAPAAGTGGGQSAAAGSPPVGVCDPGAPCQGIPCPESLPESGAACGATIVMCPFDTCTPDGGGTNLTAVCNGGSWSVVDSGCLKCCTDDSDCDGTLCVQSRCISREHDEGCFSDEECAANELCAGAQVCPCGSPADCKTDRPGVCVPKGMGCCGIDADCATGEVCVLGVCKAVPEDGRCWRNDECKYYCIAPPDCPCGQSCVDSEQPGQCGLPG